MIRLNVLRPLVALIGISLSLNLHAQADPTTEKPNILFIFADDWGWQDLSCHGHPYVKTPNIDRLAKEGTDFHGFTVASGVCSPSRAAVMTGQFPARYCIDGHFAWVPSNAKRNMPDWLDISAPSLPRMLQKAGYRTGHFGKWHLSNNMIPDSPNLLPYGYDEYGAFNCSGEQMPYDHDDDRAIAFIEESQEQASPFFINLWIHEPHTPFHVLPKYQQRFPELDQADNIYAATLAYADERIGRVLDCLDERGLTESTLVIFSSDNGPARGHGKKPELIYDSATGAGYNTGAAKGLTGGRKAWKGSLFQGGVNVPFIVRWPGKVGAEKEDKDSIISAVDLLPTFCQIAGAKFPDGYLSDGLDITPTLTGSPLSSRPKPLFWKIGANWPSPQHAPNHWAGWAVISGTHKLLASPKLDHLELYDLAVDPLEQNDIAEASPKLTTQLLKQLQSWQAELPEKPVGKVFSSLRKEP